VSAADAPQSVTAEYCLLWMDHWSTCMTKGEWSSWAQAIGALLAICVAIALPIWLDHRARLKQREGHLEMIAADVLMAGHVAAVYLKADIIAPAYRLPLLGARAALPALLADGTLRGSEGAVLTQFYVDALSFNYCLDVAQDHRSHNRSPAPEHGRAKKKATHLIPNSANSRYDAAIALLRKHLPKQAIDRLELPGNLRTEVEDEDSAPAL
jgi:hypothetical protein